MWLFGEFGGHFVDLTNSTAAPSDTFREWKIQIPKCLFLTMKVQNVFMINKSTYLNKYLCEHT
jgi:hypothetical protein